MASTPRAFQQPFSVTRSAVVYAVSRAALARRYLHFRRLKVSSWRPDATQTWPHGGSRITMHETAAYNNGVLLSRRGGSTFVWVIFRLENGGDGQPRRFQQRMTLTRPKVNVVTAPAQPRADTPVAAGQGWHAASRCWQRASRHAASFQEAKRRPAAVGRAGRAPRPLGINRAAASAAAAAATGMRLRPVWVQWSATLWALPETR